MVHEIALSNGKKIPFYFGTWSLSRFCELNGNLSFTEMQQLFAKDISFKHIISLLLCGAEHFAKKNNLPFTYSDIDASDWIDDLGGIQGQKTQELLLVVAKTINPSYQGVEIVKGKEGKKK